MQIDISKELLKWKALDRWENEGGSIPARRIEFLNNNGPDRRRAESEARPYPRVEQRSYSDREYKEQII